MASRSPISTACPHCGFRFKVDGKFAGRRARCPQEQCRTIFQIAAEEEERNFYHRRAPKEWLDALRPLGTDEHKPYLETAPWLIAVFLKRYERLPDGTKVKHYYTDESVGIAMGFMIAAVHSAGLVSLTHTPNPMSFLTDILNRPRAIERPYLLLVVGYPGADAVVPDLVRKPLSGISTFMPP